MTRNELISRLRNSIGEVNSDSEFSNRYLWNIIETNSKRLIKEDAERGRIFKQSSLWENICIELEEVSSLICNCTYLPYDCTVYRSKKQLPDLLEYSAGLVYRFIATPDLSQELTLVSPYQYSVKNKIKYNREKYAFIHDGYLYTPNAKFPWLSISSLFLSDVSDYKCGTTECVNSGCGKNLDLKVPLPHYLESACILMSLEELGYKKQMPTDQHPNANPLQKEISP